MYHKAQAKYRKNNKEKIKQYKKEYYLRKKQEKNNQLANKLRLIMQQTFINIDLIKLKLQKQF